MLGAAPDNTWPGRSVKVVDKTPLQPELDFVLSHSVFPNAPQGWRIWPSSMYVEVAGCYAWEVDGVGFTELIVVDI